MILTTSVSSGKVDDQNYTVTTLILRRPRGQNLTVQGTHDYKTDGLKENDDTYSRNLGGLDSKRNHRGPLSSEVQTTERADRRRTILSVPPRRLHVLRCCRVGTGKGPVRRKKKGRPKPGSGGVGTRVRGVKKIVRETGYGERVQGNPLQSRENTTTFFKKEPDRLET